MSVVMETPEPVRYDVAVVGGGAAGMMAVLRAVLNHQRTVWFMGDVDARRRSRAPWVSEVDNIPGLHGKSHPLPHQQVELVDWLEAQPTLVPFITALKVSVAGLTKTPEGFALTAQSRARRGASAPPAAPPALARHVVLATGITDIQPHIGFQPATAETPEVPGSIEPIFSYANANQALYCLMSDGHRVAGHRTGVIGHTSEAVAVLLTLWERYQPPALVLLTHGLPLQLTRDCHAQLARAGATLETSPIQGFEGQVKQEGLQGVVLLDGTTVPVTRLFVALGKRIYNTLALQVGAEVDPAGYVMTDRHGESTVPGLFVAGDLRSGARQQIYSAWEGAVDAIERIDERLRAERWKR